MGFLDIFSRKSGARALEKHAARVANKRAQAPDRWESIQALGEMSTPEAVSALLRRFTFVVDPSITDQDEKDAAMRAILGAGAAAVEPIRAFLISHDSLSWGLRMLQQLVSQEEVVTILLEVLTTMDTEYERDPTKKVQVLSGLEDFRDARIVPAVVPFLEDINETARFHAASTVLAQDEAEAEPLVAMLLEEESARVRAHILDGFIAKGWDFAGRVDEVRPQLPTGYVIDGEGRVSASR